MYQPYRDFPQIEDPLLMLAKRRQRELDREIAAMCLERQLQEGRTALPVWLFAQARQVWHWLWVRIRNQAPGLLATDQAMPVPEA
jgi:hypothetical protein